MDTIFLNMDAQDAQDEQEVRFLHQEPSWAMIRSGLVGAQDYKLAVSRKVLCIPVDHSFK